MLLLGAPGTGKDRLARLLHEHSSRAGAPFVRVDLAAVADDLFESELFGHERGAFHGRRRRKPGLLEGAGDGTLYLDRVDALSLRAQGKLLRVVEERLVRRGGGRAPVPLARLVASAGPDLPRRARAGTFREDLFYRLAVVTVSLPSLFRAPRGPSPGGARARESRGRPGHVHGGRAARAALPRLAREFSRARERRPPGRERRGRGRGGRDRRPARQARGSLRSRGAAPQRALEPLRQLSDAYIALLLDEAGGNVAEAARRLGVARKTLYARQGSVRREPLLRK